MKSSKLELRKIIEQYADEELSDFLEYKMVRVSKPNRFSFFF